MKTRNYVDLTGDIAAQGSCAVGATTVALVTATAPDGKVPCTRVWVGAPTANHTAGANTGNVLIGKNSSTNIVGGITIANDNYAGVWIPVDDAATLYCTGFNAGDCVEYQIYR